MIARIAKAMNEKEKGFTLVELLVVIIIIGILSAIAIPVFMNQRQKAVDSGIKSDLRTIANEVESYYVDNQEYPASVTQADDKVTIPAGDKSEAVEISVSEATTVFVYTAGDKNESYVVEGTNEDKGSGATFTYDSQNGGLQ